MNTAMLTDLADFMSSYPESPPLALRWAPKKIPIFYGPALAKLCFSAAVLMVGACSQGSKGSGLTANGAQSSLSSSSQVSSQAQLSSSSSTAVSSSVSSSAAGPVIPDPDPLANGGLAAQQDKFLGNVLATTVPSHFGVYWNQVTPENAGKWGEVEAVQDQMDWTYLDQAYGYAKANNMSFKLHTLIWGSQQPEWLADLSPTQQLLEIEQWIGALAARYPDVDMIDVVNEPQHAPPSYKAAIGGDGASGWDWVVWAFNAARANFPNAQLHLNDYGIINDITALETHLHIAEILQIQGLIDGIAIQCHAFNVNNLDAQTIRQNLNRLDDLSLPIYVSELDVDDTLEVDQAAVYAEIFPEFWQHPAVAGVTLWGYIEGQTWRSDTHSEIVNEDGSEKPAMTWLRSYFQGLSE